MTDKKLFTEVIAKMTELAKNGQRVRVERDSEMLGFPTPEWSVEGILWCEDLTIDIRHGADPDTIWGVNVGHNNVMPWDGASVSFKIKDVVRLEDTGTTMFLIVS